MAYQPDALVYGLRVYSTWRKQKRFCKAVQECAARFSAEWFLAWSILELCCLGTNPWNLYGWSHVFLTNKKREKENPSSGGRMAFDDASCEYCMGVFQGSFTSRCMADFAAAVCESSGKWNIRDDKLSWYSGIGNRASACSRN